MTLSEAVEKILANSFAPHRAILISQINDLRGRRMNLLDDLRTTLEIIYYAALIAITLFQFRAVTLKVASLFIGIVKRGTGAFIAFFASMWMGILPVSFYTSARTIPMTNLYSWGMGIAMMGTFGALLEMIGVLMMGFGLMWLIPNTRVGRHFKTRLFVRRNKRISNHPQRMGYVALSRLIGFLRP